MDHPRQGFRYVDAKDLDESGMKFDGVEVEGSDGEKLGEVEGFIIDVVARRPRHVAVAAGWFFHKHFLLPIGHVTLQEGGTKLRADLTKVRAWSNAFTCDNVNFIAYNQPNYVPAPPWWGGKALLSVPEGQNPRGSPRSGAVVCGVLR